VLGHSGARGSGFDGAGFGLEDLRAQALSYLTIALAVSAWGLNLGMPALTGSAEATARFFLASLWLMASAAAGWVVLRYNVKLAGMIVAGAATALIAFLALHQASDSVLGLLALVVAAVVSALWPKMAVA
jgi:hypothetical protein